jgi:conjugative relaxase-like TrwC/TraI family protein
MEVTRLAQGRHPKTGRQIVVGQGDKKRAAIDLTFSAPKAWTALWVVSNQQRRRVLDDMLIESVRESLDETLASGLIEARIGKGGKIREPMALLVAALYRHRTSREGDPQAHVHAALLNIGMRHDGEIRAINNEKLCDVHKVIGAAFRLRLTERLETCGVHVSADAEHGFILDGQPVGLADIWSKRRKQIVNAAKMEGLSGTAGRQKKIDRIAKMTRSKKSDAPEIEVLERRWIEEALIVGWTLRQEWSRLDRPPITRKPEEEAREAEAIVRRAMSTVTEKQSLFRRRDIDAMALTLAVGRSNAEAVRKALESYVTGPQIVDC